MSRSRGLAPLGQSEHCDQRGAATCSSVGGRASLRRALLRTVVQRCTLYSTRMVKRLFALVIALLTGGAPVALEVCQIICESKVAHAARSGAGHHHLPATDGSSHELPAAHLSGTHSCDHDRAVAEPGIAVSRDSESVPMPVAVRLCGTDDIAPVRPATIVRAARLAMPDRPEIRLSLPLRI